MGIIVGGGLSQARQLSPEEALDRALAISSRAAMRISPAAYEAPTLAYTVEMEKTPVVYVFNRASEEGFYVVAGDDNCPALLGYSDSGNIDPNNLPPAFKAWIEDYGYQIITASRNGGKIFNAPADPSLPSIAPMVATRWNQDAPYNNMCPTQNGQRTYTGCVATAICQVMNTFKYPAKGYGRFSYTWNGQTLSIDYSKSTYDWANMLDVYSAGKYNTTEANAVAKLMYDVGVASQMGYSTSGSGTTAVKAGRGLVTNFTYDKNLHYFMRDYYPLKEWCKMIHSEMQTGHPVYYDGANASAGHAFVLDGYNAADGFFHVNWGWGGSSDGYFNIVSLDPGSSQGIGGSSAGYALSQGALFGLKLPETGSKYYPLLCAGDDFCTSANTFSRSGSVTFLKNQQNKGIYSYSIFSNTFTFGVKLVSSTGATSYVWATGTDFKDRTFDPYYGVNSYVLPGASFPSSGTYTVTPAYQSGGVAYDLPVKISKIGALKLTCTSTQLNFSPIERESKLDATEIAFDGSFYQGKKFSGKCNVKNTGDEYLGELYVAIVSGNSIKQAFSCGQVDFIPGQSNELYFGGTVPTTLAAGNYQFCVLLPDGTAISELVNITVKAAPTGSASLSVGNVSFPGNTGGNGTQANPYLVSNTDLRVQADITCTEGFFDGRLAYYLFDPSNGSTVGAIYGSDQVIETGQTKKYEFAGNVSSKVAVGKLLNGAVLKIENGYAYFLSNDRYFMKFTDGNAGIEDVTTDSDDTLGFDYENETLTVSSNDGLKTIEIYALNGTKVISVACGSTEETINVSGLINGGYVVRIITDKNVFARKFNKR